MRKITFGGASSLDNFIAREDGSVDWLMWSDEAGEVTNAYWPKVDCILMGRKTYEVALANNPGGGEAEDDSGIKTYVFSRTLKQEDHKGATIISANAVEFVRELKEQDGKEICLMGGGDLAKTLFEAGLIDEIGFNIHPVLSALASRLFTR